MTAPMKMALTHIQGTRLHHGTDPNVATARHPRQVVGGEGACASDPAFAFPSQRRVPLTSAGYVREAIAEFRSFDDVSDDERELAFENIRKAAKHYHVDVRETDWRQLGTRAPKPSYARGR